MIKGSCRITVYEAGIGTNNPGEKGEAEISGRKITKFKKKIKKKL